MPFNVNAALKKAGLDEVADDVAKAINAAADEREKPLIDKREELLEEKKKLKKENDEAADKAKKAEERAETAEGSLTTTQAELEEAKKKHDDPEAQERLKEIYAKQRDDAVKKVQTESDEKQTRIDALEGREEKRTIDSAFDEAFKSSNVLEVHRRGLRLQMIDDAGKVEIEDGGRVTVDGIPVADHIESFATDEKNKLFIAAADNTGGGGTGNKDGGGTKKNPWLKEHRNLTAQGALVESDPAMAKKLAAEAGVKLDL